MYLLGHDVLLFHRAESTFIFIIKKYIFSLLARYYEVNAGRIKTGSTFLASIINKGQPQKPLTSPHPTDENKYFGNKFKFLNELVHSARKKVELLKIKRKISQLQRIIDAPRLLRPSYGNLSYDINSYFIEIDNLGVMRLIEREKDRVHEVRRTKDQDELLYWIFTNITFAMACKDKIGKNADGYDHRKHIFLVQEELLGKINPKWKERKHAEYKAFTKKYPIDDISGEGTAYFDALRKLIRSETVEKSPNYFRFP